MSCYYSGLSVSLVCVAPCWHGSGRICLAEWSELYSAALRRPLYTSCARFRKGQCYSVLGPLLFVVYTTDLEDNNNSSGDEIANVNFYAVRPEATLIR